MKLSFRRSFTLLACMVLIMGPFASTLFSLTLSEHDLARAIQLSLLLVAALALAFGRVLPPRADRITLALLSLLAALVALSAIGAAVPMAAWREAALFAGLGAWAVIVANASKRDDAELWFVGICLSQFLYGLTFVGLVAAAIVNHQPVLLWDMSLGYDNPRFLNHVQAAVLPLLLGIAARPGATRCMQAMTIVALTLQLFLLMATLGRSTMLGLAVAAVAVLLVLGRSASRWLVIGMAATVIAGVAYLGLQSEAAALQQTVGYTPTVKELTSDHSREYLWQIALADAGRSPVFGLGLMHFAHEINAKGAHPHNFYLQLAAELGWPALTIVVALASRGLWKMSWTLRAETDPDRRAVGAGLLGACTAIAVDAGFSGNFVMPLSQIWIFSVLGLSFGWYAGRARFIDAHSSPLSTAGRSCSVWLILRLYVVLVSLWSCLAASGEIKSPTPHLQVRGAKEPVPHVASRPRFWSYGWF